MTVLLLDDLDESFDDAGEPFEVIWPRALPLAPGDFFRMALLYEITELATAVKPWLLQALVDDGSESVMYLDPDIEVFAPLDDVFEAARQHGIVITPHADHPIPRDGSFPDETSILAAGVYNLGFIAVGAATRDFLTWWQERLRRECIIDPSHMRFVDQRWVDFVPGLFPHVISRDPTINVAYWNLHGRLLEREASGWTINGAPLRFFHFSGYDPDHPYVLTKHDLGQGRLHFSQRPALAELAAHYDTRLRAEGWRPDRDAYGLERLPDGTKIDDRMRKLYRDGVRRHEEPTVIERSLGLSMEREPPNPFVEGQCRDFIAWLREPIRPRSKPIVSRYLYEVWSESVDLQREFPTLAGGVGASLLEWFRAHGGETFGIPPSLLPTASDTEPLLGAARKVTRPLSAGVNLVGYLDAVLGIGQAGRLVAQVLDHSGVPYRTVVNEGTPNRRSREPQVESGEAFDVNVVCVNADQTPAFAQEVGGEFFAGRWTIGQWFWEVEEFPRAMHGSFDFVDEVWAPSEFIAEVLRPLTDKPVRTIRLPLIAPPATAATREELGLPRGRPIVLFSFDFLSVFARKNPIGTVEAFRRAFPRDDGPALVIKSINGVHRPAEVEALYHAIEGRDDIILIDRYLSAGDQGALLSHSDLFISLHRAEGLGLGIAEAMALGKPVISTYYGGVTSFSDSSVVSIVPHRMVPIGKGREPYPPSADWAEPDVEAAAERLRWMFQNPSEMRDLGRRAEAHIQQSFSVAAVAPAIVRGINAGRARRGRGVSTWRTAIVQANPALRGVGSGLLQAVRDGYPYDLLPDGHMIDPLMRHLFAEARAESMLDGRGLPPDPCAREGSDRFKRWMKEPVYPQNRPLIPRYAYELWLANPSVHAAFPHLGGGDSGRYLEWFSVHGPEIVDAPLWVFPTGDEVLAMRTAALGAAILPGGIRVDHVMCAAAESAAETDDPAPHGGGRAGSQALKWWMLDPPREAPHLNRYLYAYWSLHVSIREAFPNVHESSGAAKFLEFIRAHGIDTFKIPMAMIPHVSRVQ